MSNRFDKELSKLKYAKLQQVSDNEYYIPKEVGIRLEVDACYLIKIIQPNLFNTSSVITTNWNRGIIPKCLYYKGEIQTIMGDMIKVVGIGFDSEDCLVVKDNWLGWFTLDGVEILKKL